MKCQKCGKSEANTHITQVLNGNKTEMYLCGDCAGETQDIFLKPVLDHDFENLFSGFWGTPKNHMLSNKKETKKCPVCNMTEAEFVHSGKPGCSNCYTVFSDYLLRPLKQLHGSLRHTGKFPSRAGKKMSATDKLEKLQSELNVAVMSQNFEQAAVLRDKINELKNNR